MRLHPVVAGLLTLLAGTRLLPAPGEPGLLFYLSADHGTTADVASPGTATPTFDTEVRPIPDGAHGAALECGDRQQLAWRAPGNVYAERGTLAFFWRSRYPVGPTAFPIFRVGYGDHSSWDMVWLRIDYNGAGFDAFVTDASLARTRVSVPLPQFPDPQAWTHLALTWDETQGIRFYINGKLAAEKLGAAVYAAALDQFGPHSRIISPHNVQSDYNFVRGGDIDELRIYDHGLPAAQVARLAAGEAVTEPPVAARRLADPATQQEWAWRHGWNHPDRPPPYYAGPAVAVRKVEIHDAFDKQRWWWKATDGIRETTWPGVYNRSRLPGRNDYFQLPDWDCYVESGQAITFALPDEPWNHVELAGAAWGKMEILAPGVVLEKASEAPARGVLFERPRGEEKTVHQVARTTGGAIRFTNVEQEQPIGELVVYDVTPAAPPPGTHELAFRLDGAPAPSADVTRLQDFIAGRFPADERATLVGAPVTAGGAAAPASAPAAPAAPGLPIVHVLIPDTWDELTDGLDGVVLELPALAPPPAPDALLPVNIQVKDPLWPARNLLDFTTSVRPGEAKRFWLDTRDRLLPRHQPLWISLAAARADFSAASLRGATVRLVFKDGAAARAEHELDRFTQARDAYAMLVEEHPHSPKLNLWVRFESDLDDLLRVNPRHPLGLLYAAAGEGRALPAPPLPAVPAGTPAWAARQVQLLDRVQRFVFWYIDHRQSRYGDFGGGISDDVDLLNTWPGVALMGSDPDKIRQSLHALLEAAFRNGMFTHGLPTIQADELHSYEEGINCLAQNLILDYGNPVQLERAMVTAQGVAGLTGINSSGHRFFRTSYYSGRKLATEAPWGQAKAYSYLVLQPGQLLVDFNGSPRPRQTMLELADGLLSHRTQDEGGNYALPTAIEFATNRNLTATRGYFPWHVFWGAWKWTGKKEYLQPIFDAGVNGVTAVSANALDVLDLRASYGPRLLAGERGRPTETRPNDGRGPPRPNNYRVSGRDHFQWQLNGDKSLLEKLYSAQIQECDNLEYINTVGSLWIDRVGVPYAELQRARLGGVALVRNALYPGHVVSWRFAAPATATSVAVLVPDGNRTHFKVIAHNLDDVPVRATMTGWDLDPGVWEITQGIDTRDADVADAPGAPRAGRFGRSCSLDFELPPHATTVLALQLRTPGVPYWQRPDLGLARDEVRRSGDTLEVRVHSVGAVPAPAAHLVARDRAGRILATAGVPALDAPTDLVPKTADVTLALPAGADVATVEVELPAGVEEITELNNRVAL